MTRKFILISVILPFLSCQPSPRMTDESSFVPAWTKCAIWYQIMVERFRNGDLSNDPTITDIEGGYENKVPENWHITPWGWDWYREDDYFDEIEDEYGFHSKVQMRRYGGDLQGVWDKLDYLQNLGVNAVFFNPLNDAPTLHKYDARNYRHIDRNFGPDPVGDGRMMKNEKPDDPATWQWTAADRLFLELIRELHRRGMKVIMDYSWNHTGKLFWALEDVRVRGKESPYADWYEIKSFGNPKTAKDEFEYVGWNGVKNLPEFKKDIIGDDEEFPFEGNLYSQTLKEHIFNVTRRWLDPDGDGDPSDGVDGFRLDVAAEIPKGFWVDYRKVVKTVNPEAVLIGEIWWKKFPDDLMDPREFLQGDMFDAIMNYRWYREARRFFGQPEISHQPESFTAALEALNQNMDKGCVYGMMNLSASHDVPRVGTSLYNSNKYKFQAKPTEDPEYKIHKPDAYTRKIQRMLLVHQFTWVGAPHIWNGDEMGMWGADDPDCRKPLIWPDIEFEDETAHLLSDLERPVDKVAFDQNVFDMYRELAQVRSTYPALNHGEIEYILTEDQQMLWGYRRFSDDQELLILFNRSEEKQEFSLEKFSPDNYSIIYGKEDISLMPGNSFTARINPLGAVIILKKE